MRGALWVRKFGYLGIREILVDRTSARLSVHTTGIVVVQNNGKKVCCTCKFVFLLLRSINFVAVRIAVAVYDITRFFLYFFFRKYLVSESFVFSSG